MRIAPLLLLLVACDDLAAGGDTGLDPCPDLLAGGPDALDPTDRGNPGEEVRDPDLLPTFDQPNARDEDGDDFGTVPAFGGGSAGDRDDFRDGASFAEPSQLDQGLLERCYALYDADFDVIDGIGLEEVGPDGEFFDPRGQEEFVFDERGEDTLEPLP